MSQKKSSFSTVKKLKDKLKLVKVLIRQTKEKHFPQNLNNVREIGNWMVVRKGGFYSEKGDTRQRSSGVNE